MTPIEPISVQNGTVCVVTERRKLGSAGISTPGDSLFGVFTDEATARKEYGAIEGDYIPTFDVVPLFSPPSLLAELRTAREALGMMRPIVQRVADGRCSLVAGGGYTTCIELRPKDTGWWCPTCKARAALASPDTEGGS